MQLELPQYVEYVLDTLEKNGFQAYVVGGAVRDAIMGKTPGDWDVTTNAHTQQIKACFSRHFDTGIKHGTITVLTHKKPVEVTTYRIDGEYTDNRRPDNVVFTSKLAEDLKRRDFTVNAMAYNHKSGIVDLFGGMEDLQGKVIRCVGDANKRFCEDALRIMRGIRFAVTMGFEIEKSTFEAILENRHLLKNISGERIQTELVKTLEANRPLDLFFESGVADVVIPEAVIYSVPVCTVADREIRLAALFLKTATEDILKMFARLKFDNKTKNNVIKILECFCENVPIDDFEIKKALNKYGENTVSKMIVIKQSLGNDMAYFQEVFNRVKKEPYTIKALAISGNDLMELGIFGRNIGKVCESLLSEVMKNPALNTREKLINLALGLK